MATTQLPIDGVFDKDTGKFLGVSDEMKEISLATIDEAGGIGGPNGTVLSGAEVAGARDALGGGSLSKSPLTSASANPPTITVGGSATSIVGGTVVGADDGAFTYYGATNLQFWNGSFVYNLTGKFTTVEFMTTSALFEIFFIRYNTSAMIFVDGEPASSSKIQLDAAGPGAYTKVDFNGVKRPRKITISGVNMPFGGVVLTAGDAIWDAPLATKHIAFCGDSYTFGNGANAQSFAYSISVARMLGMQPYIDAVGGTGWTSSGANSPVTRLNIDGANKCAYRRSGINTPVTPTKHIAALGYNDAGGSMATVSTSIVNYVQASIVKPLFIGPWTPLGNTSNLTTVASTVQQAAQANSCQYLDIAGFVNAANAVSLTGGDNTHPTQIGHDYLAFRIANKARLQGLL